PAKCLNPGATQTRFEEGTPMERAYGLEIPESLEEACHPQRTALVVYDMQVGILRQLRDAAGVTARVGQVLRAARAAGLRVFFMRHLSLPRELSGVSQLRMAKAWQLVASVTEVRPWFLRHSPGVQLAPELTPLDSQAILDKMTMSAFERTLPDSALRDCGRTTVVIIGVAA